MRNNDLPFDLRHFLAQRYEDAERRGRKELHFCEIEKQFLLVLHFNQPIQLVRDVMDQLRVEDRGFLKSDGCDILNRPNPQL